MNDKKNSIVLEEFLGFLREISNEKEIALSNEKEADAETQDILHSIELSDHNYHDYAKLSKKLKEVRKKRREAKNIVEMNTPIVDWCDNNKAIVKSLEKLLGELRKVEKTVENRQYGVRTNVLDEIEGLKS